MASSAAVGAADACVTSSPPAAAAAAAAAAASDDAACGGGGCGGRLLLLFPCRCRRFTRAAAICAACAVRASTALRTRAARLRAAASTTGITPQSPMRRLVCGSRASAHRQSASAWHSSSFSCVGVTACT